MNREIKFRGERLSKANEWVYGDLLLTDCQDENGRCYTRCEIRSMLPLTGPVFYEVDPATIGQYTGLKDYNNVEIYEGDIIESVFMPIKPSENDQVILGVVEWWAERAEYIVNCNNIDDFDIKALRNRSGYKYADGKFTMSFALKGKVIGNIHDDGDHIAGISKMMEE